ncbi:DUF5753 domain-containing protein [Allonocardiopsis opalescens]|uniref:DUF5753 domain-containing protein n=1 Tax=Allonocardiopsis opalescens TaxID=1144618 RepID=UPI001FE606C7|nr:DUF5753 domain-containing protein [Allonocardiopsis opalescens]
MDWLDTLTDLQAEAEMVREWHPTLVPGLLQSRSYAQAIVAAGSSWLTPEDVDDFVAARMARAARILGAQTPGYHVVLDDTIVLRDIGPAEVMAEQIRTLIQIAESSRVMIQLYPFGLWPHPGLDGPFSVLSSASAPDVAHVETVYRGQTSDEPGRVRQFMTTFSLLQASARSPRESVQFLKSRLKEYEHGN